MSALLAALCGLLAVATAWELLGTRGERGGEAIRRFARRRRGVGLGSPARLPPKSRRRLTEAGLSERFGYGPLLVGKLTAAAVAVPLGSAIAGVFPPRLQPLLAIAIPVAAFWIPDAYLAKRARARREALLAELPAALDLMATGAGAGRGVNALLADAMRHARGPLRGEIARAVVAIECGTSQQEAIAALGERASGTRLGAVAGALERSRRHGAPLARSLHEQASTVRADQRRDLAEHAARAAPKMQLAVALILVPSVLIVVAAAIIANADSLLPGF